MLQIVFHQTQIQGGMNMSVNMLYQTVQILVTFFYSLVQQITQKADAVKLKILRYEAPYFSCQAVIQYTTCNMFSNTFETARYKMISHVIVFLVLF